MTHDYAQTMSNATAYSAVASLHISTALPLPSTVLPGAELPGPLSLQRLLHIGAVHKLDDTNAYLAEHATTLYGRGALMQSMAPKRTSICALSAAWVWLGGDLPNTVDILSTSHFRSLVFGRKIRVFNRHAPQTHMTVVGDLHLTSPMRTACDIALLSDAEAADVHASDMVCSLMESYAFRPADCLRILEENRFWQNAPKARAFFGIIEHCY